VGSPRKDDRQVELGSRRIRAPARHQLGADQMSRNNSASDRRTLRQRPFEEISVSDVPVPPLINQDTLIAAWKSGNLPYPRGAQEPISMEIHKSFGTLEFRKPYRIRGVQSFRDKCAIRRIISAPCQERVRSSNEKSLPILGLMPTNSRREYTASAKAGGGRATGFEPSPCWPTVSGAIATYNDRRAPGPRGNYPPTRHPSGRPIQPFRGLF
jgi:hypothetical protein